MQISKTKILGLLGFIISILVVTLSIYVLGFEEKVTEKDSPISAPISLPVSAPISIDISNYRKYDDNSLKLSFYYPNFAELTEYESEFRGGKVLEFLPPISYIYQKPLVVVSFMKNNFGTLEEWFHYYRADNMEILMKDPARYHYLGEPIDFKMFTTGAGNKIIVLKDQTIINGLDQDIILFQIDDTVIEINRLYNHPLLQEIFETIVSTISINGNNFSSNFKDFLQFLYEK